MPAAFIVNGFCMPQHKGGGMGQAGMLNGSHEANADRAHLTPSLFHDDI
jgi:hypothetical protein